MHRWDPNRYYHSGSEGILHISQSSRIEASQLDDLVSYLEYKWGGFLILCSLPILKPQLNGPLDTRWRSLTPLQRCSRRIQEHSLGESYPSAEMQSAYSKAPAKWATGHSLGEPYTFAEMQSAYSGTLVGGVLPFCRDAVGVFRNTRWGSLTLLQRCSLPILKPQLNGPLDTRWGSLTPLQRCSRRIQEHSLGESYPSAEMQSAYSGTLVGGVLPFCRDAVCLF